ncbi:MAG: hypothetical protein ACO1RX_04320 [Candidatus Sericytochromatia bacterium]
MPYRILLLSACLLLGCQQSPEGQSCTLIGCQDGLSVRVDSAVGTAFTLELKTPDGATRSLICPAGGEGAICLNETVLISDYLPEQLSVTLTAGERSVSRDFTPVYIQNEPNGAGCGPSCKQGSVEIGF